MLKQKQKFILTEIILKTNKRNIFLIQADNEIEAYDIIIANFSDFKFHKNGFHIIKSIYFNNIKDIEKDKNYTNTISLAIDNKWYDYLLDIDLDKILKRKYVINFFNQNSDSHCVYNFDKVKQSFIQIHK